MTASTKGIQLSLFDVGQVCDSKAVAHSTRFVANMRLPVHRWFRFSAGFSARWAESMIHKAAESGSVRVFDPFAGSGTTLLSAETAGVSSIGIEAHPFIVRLAEAKLLHRSDSNKYREMIRCVREDARQRTADTAHYPALIRKCYTPEALAKLDALRRSLEHLRDNSSAWKLAWLTLVSILRISSPVGTAPWQYILPNKKKKRVMDPFDAFDWLSHVIHCDLRISRERVVGPRARIIKSDARTCEGVPDRYATLVLTSPPYPNNYDYADATRLEMCFLGEIAGWADLQTRVRSNLIRSCSQHVPQKAVDLEAVLSSQELEPIHREISEVCRRLAEIRKTRGGKKTYHLMVACYFLDLAHVWRSLRRVCDSPSRVCFVIGDSAPYGVYVSVIEWLGRLAEAAGFLSWTFEKTRDRNVKWKNRKHRVPLCEGQLWVEG